MPRYGGDHGVTHLYVCQGCEVPSRWTRRYSLLTVIFLFVFAIWRVDTVMKCPHCMRQHILVRLPLAILLANVLSPLVILWWLVMYVRTFSSPTE